MPPVSAPYKERIVEYSAVHPHCTVYVILCQRRGTYNHAVCQVVIQATFRHAGCQLKIVVIKPVQII